MGNFQQHEQQQENGTFKLFEIIWIITSLYVHARGVIVVVIRLNETHIYHNFSSAFKTSLFLLLRFLI